MRKLSLILLTTLLASVAPVAAASRATPRAFVLEGERSASAIVRLDRKVVISCCRFGELSNEPGHFGVEGLAIETGGDYAGFVVERVRDGRVLLMAIRVPVMDLADGVVETALTFGRDNVLKPGLYRFHLVTDGSSRVSVAARGLSGPLHLRPTAPTRITATLVDLLADGRPFGQARIPVDVGRRSMVGLLSHEEGDDAQAHYQSHCLTQPGSFCGEISDQDPHLSPGSGGGGGTIATIHRPGEVAPGSYEAVFTGGNVATSSEAHGFILVFR